MENEETKATGLEQLRNMFNSLDINSKIIISGLLVVIVVGIILTISLAMKPEYVLLYGGLDLKDASEIIQELDSQNVRYKVRSGGRDIMVPRADRDKLRISLAGNGFLPSNTTGYELFDKNRMTLSTFEQKVDFKRAQEGELARTLMSIEEIEYARVHLVLPDPSPFFEDESKPSASVVLKLRGASRLNPSKVGAVANLVATAVGGMDPADITIMDDRANLLSGGNQSGDMGLELLPNQQKYRAEFEESVRQKVRAVLEPAYGIGNVSIAVSADFDFDKVEEEKTTYEPMTGSDTGILRSHEMTESSSENAPINQGGIAGASSNIPSYEGYESTSGQESKTLDTSEIKNYEVNQTQTRTKYAQGAIKKMSISVLLNVDKLTALEKSDLENLVRTAANLSETRGDMVAIAAQVFDTTFEEEIAQAQAASIASSKKKGFFVYAVLFFTLLLAVFALYKIMRPVAMPSPETAPIEEVITREDMEWEPVKANTEGLARSRMREDILRIAKEHPEEAARVVKSWLKE